MHVVIILGVITTPWIKNDKHMKQSDKQINLYMYPIQLLGYP